MTRAFLTSAFVVLLMFSATSIQKLSAQSAPPVRKLAFLVGVSKYEKDGLNDLNYPERDMTELKLELEKAGFTVRLLTGSGTGRDRADLPRLNTEWQTFLNQVEKLAKTDLVLVAMSGHGRQVLVTKDAGNGKKRQVEDAFFCPVDCLVSNPDTLWSIGDVIDQVTTKSGSSQNLFVVDACRFNPGKGRGVDGGTVDKLHNKISVLFSCSSGEEAQEYHDLRHGLFSYHLLEGLRGKAKLADGRITWLSLAAHVTDTVTADSEEREKQSGKAQHPNLINNLKGASPLLSRFGGNQTAKTITNQIGMKLVLIPSGEFEMGSNDGEDDEKPVHRVRISQAFYLQTTEVTQGQWKSVMGTEPWKGQEYVREGVNYPAVYVSWDDAQEFCKKLSGREKVTYRLPTEAEWEYACRAGTKTKYSFGDDDARLGDFAWFDKNAWDVGEKYAHLVGQKQPNPFGLYDMHGNVWEWCSDGYDAKYYGNSVTQNPPGPSGAADRVYRGGGWGSDPQGARSANRSGDAPGFRGSSLGFRVLAVQSK